MVRRTVTSNLLCSEGRLDRRTLMSPRSDENETGDIGRCENPQCGREGVPLYVIFIWEAPGRKVFRALEVCESCNDAHERGELNWNRILRGRGPGNPS